MDRFYCSTLPHDDVHNFRSMVTQCERWYDFGTVGDVCMGVFNDEDERGCIHYVQMDRSLMLESVLRDAIVPDQLTANMLYQIIRSRELAKGYGYVAELAIIEYLTEH